MDLDYWIDYVNKFDVGHKIPLYDGQSFIQYYHLDIYVPVFVVLAIILFICESIFVCKDNAVRDAVIGATDSAFATTADIIAKVTKMDLSKTAEANVKDGK